MSHTTEYIPEAGLTVIRQAVNPELIKQFEAECRELMHDADEGGSETGVHEGIEALTFTSDKLMGAGFKAVSEVLRGLNRTGGYKATVNHQLAGGKQKFHDDGTGVQITEDHPMIVVQASDGGVFDYAPTAKDEEEAEAQAIPLTVNAGDVIIQRRANLIHRGRNPSDHDRFNMVLWQKRQPVSLNEIIKESQTDSWE